MTPDQQKIRAAAIVNDLMFVGDPHEAAETLACAVYMIAMVVTTKRDEALDIIEAFSDALTLRMETYERDQEVVRKKLADKKADARQISALMGIRS